MKEKEHHVQDALEVYAAARLQELAEADGVATTSDSEAKLDLFWQYANERNLAWEDFQAGEYSAYLRSLEKHLPEFLSRLIHHFRGATMDFVNVEVEQRALGMKADFEVRPSTAPVVPVSLKNYRGGASRPQLSSGTFNSFAVGMMLEPAGVGMWLDPIDGHRFRGATVHRRDSAVAAAGFASAVPLLRELDTLNDEIKKTFVYSDDFEFLDESKFDRARKRVGNAGADIVDRLLSAIPATVVKARMLKMTGFDGSEELLIMDPDRMAESITESSPFHKIRRLLRDPGTTLQHQRVGQSIRFDFANSSSVVLTVDVPFTINKNGAWISDESYGDGRWHKKEGRVLAYRQRRPRKSKELATSINTYAEFERAGIFNTIR